jgi:hypothetical protein
MQTGRRCDMTKPKEDWEEPLLEINVQIIVEKLTTVYQIIEAYAQFKTDLEQDGHIATPEFFFEVYEENIDVEQVIESILRRRR